MRRSCGYCLVALALASGPPGHERGRGGSAAKSRAVGCRPLRAQGERVRATSGVCASHHHPEQDVDLGPRWSPPRRGKQQGATLRAGGSRVGERGYFVQPTVFADVGDEMGIARQVMANLGFAIGLRQTHCNQGSSTCHRVSLAHLRPAQTCPGFGAHHQRLLGLCCCCHPIC